MKEVTVPFPDVETHCPSCNTEVLLPGYECDPWSDGFARGIAFCEDCDEEFRVIVGED